MSAPHKLSRKLHEAIGDEAAEAMIDWMNRVDGKLDEVRRDLADFRQTVRADFAEVRQEMNTGLADVRQEMRVGFAKTETAAAQRHADFMKWTMGFWAVSLMTYVGALVALAKVLR